MTIAYKNHWLKKRRMCYTNLSNFLANNLKRYSGKLISIFCVIIFKKFIILRYTPSTRDFVALAELFMHLYTESTNLQPVEALYHSIEANLLDALGVLPSRITFDRQQVTKLCQKKVRFDVYFTNKYFFLFLLLVY